jgi:hypothetical protein
MELMIINLKMYVKNTYTGLVTDELSLFLSTVTHYH